MWLFGDTCDGYATADLTMKYQTVGTSTDPDKGTKIVPAAGRYGGNAIRLIPDGHYISAIITRGVPPSSATGFISFSMRVPSLEGAPFGFVEMRDGASDEAQILFSLGADGSFTAWSPNDHFANPYPLQWDIGQALIAQSESAIHANTWHTVEFSVKPHATAGTIAIRVDGRTVLSVSGINTIGIHGGPTYSMWAIGDYSGSPSYVDVDDIVMYDDVDVGDGFTSFVGGLIGEASLVTGAGATSDWTPSAGANDECVDDDTPDGDTTTVTADDGLTDTYAHAPLSRISDGIVMAQVVTVGKRADVGVRAIRGVVRVSGTDYPGDEDLFLAGDYTAVATPYAKNPATDAPWSAIEVNACEIGQKTL
jgi:hypothetical protein